MFRPLSGSTTLLGKFSIQLSELTPPEKLDTYLALPDVVKDTMESDLMAAATRAREGAPA